MSRRLRLPLQPWLARAQSTTSRPALPSPLQRELFRRVAQPVAVLTARIPSSPSASSSPTVQRSASGQDESHNHGATLSSLASISLSPPLVSFSLRLPSRLAAFLSAQAPTDTGDSAQPTFRVHLLSTKQESLARAFARQAPLPAKAQPSPPPSPLPPASSASGSAPPAPTAAHFDPALFAELERTGLGSLECRVVKRVPLSPLAADDGARTREDLHADENQPRSELFIARVESVKLGEAGEAEDGETALLYWDQRYAGVKALETVGEAGR